MLKVAVMHCDLPRTNWHASELQNFTYRYLPKHCIDYKLIFHGETLPDEKDIDLIDMSEWVSSWQQEIALSYSIPIVCSTEEGSLNSLNNYLLRNNINIRLMLSRIKHFIARTSWTKDMLLRLGIDKDKITRIPYGVDLYDFYPVSREPEEPAFLYIGSVNRQKGIHHLIDAYLKIEDKTDWRLKLCFGEFNNDDVLLERIKKLAEKNSKIELTPFPSVEELPKVYHEASCFVIPQDYNTPVQFSYPSVWALSSGLPIISLNIGALRDYIKNSENGFLCNNKEEIAERMMEITEMDWKEMGKASRGIGEELFDPMNVAEKYKEVYKKI